MTFHKDDDMTAYQFIVPEDENEIQTYVAEIDEEELNEFASWEDEPKTPIQINNNNLSESEKTDIINTIESYIFADHYTKLCACTVSEHHIHT